ncbi:laminin EGF-like protein [Necator americanus]|uniref:Laminin EGF-like protein n=1 Tax=Necator americanus TaxID=51031 RepID=W2SWZ5_NECAM|nr:laminin EGF-like protein [Necator americanus]ETN73227.1 laminin EGF-like protein [Necator americanus]
MSAITERGLFPSIFNLATNSLINATATCGYSRREEYCKLVEHVLLRKTATGGEIIKNSHENFLQMRKKILQEYQVAYVIIKMGNAPRPGTWVLEKSLDGVNYEPWQYYAMSDAECMRQFGVPATTGVPKFQRDDEVHCTSEYSKITPLEGGEIHTSLVNGRPGVEKPSLELQKFTRARYVRLRLISPRTLNADLMIINRQTHRIDKSVTMRYFYSISDISIGGQCICYGHAESCPSDPVTGQFKCECRHNTCGESCNRCCPMFNQLPWKPGTNAHPNICQQCQCFNHADSCVYDEELDNNKWSITPEGVYEGGGRCLDCKHNTEGFNCERCKDGYYRPSGLSHYREDACRTCDCDLTGSISDVCIRDDQSALSGQHPGDCVCKPGFGGRRCERCARGYRNYPKCEPCPCNQAGSVNFDTCEEEKCKCKTNVEGLYCDRCRPGTIHLDAENPLGCQACFCFGMTDKCREIAWTTAVISNNVGWNLTDLSGGRDVRPEVENREVLMFNANQNKDRSLFYWKAPDTFTGNMVGVGAVSRGLLRKGSAYIAFKNGAVKLHAYPPITICLIKWALHPSYDWTKALHVANHGCMYLNSYGGHLHYFVYYVPMEQGNSVPVADLVIETMITSRIRENFSREGPGWYNSVTRTPADKADMLRALAGVERFLVRAMYQQQQLQSSIFGLTLDTAVPPPEGSPVDQMDEDVLHPAHPDTRMRGVEVCECPENFAGNSCESCAPGYRRVNNQLYGGRCEKCSCQGHTDTCDPFTGECTNCKHNTTGVRCELCLPGHYGNPSLGGELGACRPCACPTAENSRSAECVMTQLVVAGPAASQEDAYVCTACERGYEGNKCEVCADGFFGNPLEKNGTCKECECNGNIDLMAIGNCDSETGKCLKCIGDTTGEHCEACECDPLGSDGDICDLHSGQCVCKPGVTGLKCDQCQPNHYGLDEEGCKGKSAIGERCDQCRPSYFNFTDAGCQFCHCNIYGSIEDGKCNNVTGKCECRDNVDGTMCEKCADGFFNITSGTGCQACECDPLGSDGDICDLHSGQCVCKPGVTGLKCDQCQPNHYGLDEEGCKGMSAIECQACPAPGQVCDPITGECVCPPNTVGAMCENCTENAWDYHPLQGCKLCQCSEVGSSNGKCDFRTGQCKCRNEYVGLRCDRCTHGFYGFPECHACDCEPAGTDPLQCKDGLCLCSEEGECPCKKNVIGEKCDRCKDGTFSLDSSNRLGCTECFCFNRSSTCEQSALFWAQTYAEDRRAVFEEPWEYYTKKHNLNLLKEYPAKYNSYPTDAVPLYWPLPKSMLGDRTGSYNGFLRFTIWNEDNRRGVEGVRPDNQYFRYFPQVVLVGNNRIELEHIPMTIAEDGKYKVRLHESEWRSRQSPELPVTRKQMMIALQNLQGIYVRGTYNYPARGDAITMSEVSLDVAVPESSGASGSTAIGVEQCLNCPQGFTGASCQNPAQGYCRKKQRSAIAAQLGVHLNVEIQARFQADRMNKGAVSLEQFTDMAEDIISESQLTYATVFNTTQFLKHFHTHGGTSVGGATLDAWALEAEAHYNATLDRGEYIEKRHNRAEQEHKKTEELLKKVLANKLNDTSFENLLNRLEEFDQWLEDFRATIYDSARRDTTEAERMSAVVAKRIDRYKEVSNEIEKLRAEAEDDLATARNSVDQAKGQELLNLFDDSRAINETLETAAELSLECRNTSMMYAQLIDEYDDIFVQSAAEHAEKLERTADVLKNSFKDTRTEAEDPLKASQAYEEIASALKNATNAADDAVVSASLHARGSRRNALLQKAAEDAYAEADGDSETSMVKKVDESKKASQALAEGIQSHAKYAYRSADRASEAREIRKQWEDSGMEAEREQLDERLAYVNEQNIDMIKRNDVIKNQWSKFDDHHDRTIGLQSVARDADKRAEIARKTIDALVKEVKDVEERTSKLLNSTGQGIREDIEKVRKARMDLEKSREVLEKVGGVSAANRNRADEMQKQLALLKDKINEAREKAQQVRLSLRSDERGVCQRSFTSPAHPSPSNSFSIRYRPLRNVPDSAVFITRTKPRRTQPSEFIAVEIRDKRVVAHWNIGGGAKMATNSHSILYVPNTDRSHWYHIDVTRIGNALNLTVALKETITGARKSCTFTRNYGPTGLTSDLADRLRTDAVSVFVGDGEWDGEVVFNTIPGETQLSMGTDAESAEEMGLATNKFYGVIGGITVDDVSIPLWAFSSSSPECEGAPAPPQPTVRGYMFRDGFAQVELATFERTVSSLSVIFNAYSPNGLLYFRGSETSGDFIALQLKDGYVVFKIHLGGSSYAELTSKNTYADGREHTVKAIRSGLEIHLQVDSDADRFSTTIPGENTALNIETDMHFVAGVPSSFKVDRFKADIEWKGFFGCILSVKPSQASDLNLDHPVRWQRREPGCQFTDAKLMPTDRLGYLAFYLFRGYLVLHFGKDASFRRNVVTIRSGQMYNDGQLHSVFMSRKGKLYGITDSNAWDTTSLPSSRTYLQYFSVRLRVDDKEVGEKYELSDESPIGTATSQMYIGGAVMDCVAVAYLNIYMSRISIVSLPSELLLGFAERSKPPNNEIPTTVPLIGCISDMYHNYKKIPIVPDEHNAQIGTCAIESPNFAIPIEAEKLVAPVDNKPSKESMKTCGGGFSSSVRDATNADDSSNPSNAVRYGISKSSHSRVNFEGKQYPNISDFQVSFSMRTDQPTGMLWVWANYKNFTRYFYLNLIEGFLTIEVKGRHPEPKILECKERRLDDGHWHDVVIIKKERELVLMVDELLPTSIVDCPSPKVMRRRMYIGGVISKHRSTFNLQTPGYDGCIRDFKVNNVVQSLEGESSRDIIPCARPTKGMYAHEGGFAVFDGLQKSIKDGSRNINIALSFRPIVNEGTIFALLTNSNPETARLSIEIMQDKVLVTVIHEASGLEIRDAIPTIRPLCDGRWHTIHLLIGEKIMEIKIDEERNELPVEHMSQNARDLLLNLPLNIAGVSGASMFWRAPSDFLVKTANQSSQSQRIAKQIFCAMREIGSRCATSSNR